MGYMRCLLFLTNLFAGFALAITGSLSTRTAIVPTYVYIRYAAENLDVYRMRAGEDLRLTTHPAMDMQPVLSPDRVWIVFISYRDGNAELYRIRTDGTDLKRLTYNPEPDQDPRWMGTGQVIRYVSVRQGVQYIYQTDLDGDQQQAMTLAVDRRWRRSDNEAANTSLTIPEKTWQPQRALLGGLLLFITGVAGYLHLTWGVYHRL